MPDDPGKAKANDGNPEWFARTVEWIRANPIVAGVIGVAVVALVVVASISSSNDSSSDGGATSSNTERLDDSSGGGASTDGTGPMPDVVCFNLQDAQDSIQAEAGVFFSRSYDATGQGRSQIIDSNWVVVEQTPSPGTIIGEGDANLGAVQYGESNLC